MRNLLKISILSAGLLAALAPLGANASFTIGNLAVEELYTNNTSSTFEIVELNPYVSNSVPVSTVQIPYTGASALRQSSAGSTGRLALSQDRTLLAFTAAEDAVGVADETTITNRGIGTVDASGNYSLQASYKGIGSKSNQARSASSLDDVVWYCGDKGGVYTNNSGPNPPPNATNVRPIKSFGGALYALQAGAGSVIQQITPGTVALTSLTGLATDANALDFYMFASGANGVTNDTIYTDDGTTINKYCLTNGTWTSYGSANCGVTADGLCAMNIGTNALIYVTTGTGGQVFEVTDTNGYGATIGFNTNNNVLVYFAVTATSTNYLKGIDFTPIPKLYTEQLPTSGGNDQQITLAELNPYLSNSVPVNTVAIPITGVSALRQSSSASSGRLALTGDRTLLAFTGYNDPLGLSGTNEADVNQRGVGTIDSTPSGDYALQATYTGVGGSTANQTRSATSLTSSNGLWYMGDKGGIYTNNTTSAVNTTNVRPIKVFGGTVYVCAATSSSANPVVLNTLSADATSLTPLPGLTTLDGNALDFYMIQSGANSNLFDVAYVNDVGGGVNGVTKYSLVSGSWVQNGSATSIGVTADGLCALNIGGGAKLYVTTGTGAQVVQVTDTAGWNQAPVINTANNVVLYSVSGYLKGLEFAPVTGIASSGPTLNTPPTITADPNATVDHPFTNTFTDNPTWRAAITNIQVNGVSISASAYNTNVAGEVIFTPSLAAALQTSGGHSIVYYATNYNADVVAQSIAPGAAKGLSVTAEPASPTGNGGTLLAQPSLAIVDQYGNPATNLATVVASPGFAGWNFGPGSSTTIAFVNGTANFTNLSVVSSAAVSGATISFVINGLGTLPYSTTNSTAFNIPAPVVTEFTPGDVVVEQLDSQSLKNSTFTMLELNPSATNPVPVLTLPVPATATNGLRQSDSASTGDLSDSQDGTLVCFTAGNWSDSTLSDVTTVNSRGAGTFNFQGGYNLAATYKGDGIDTDQARSGATIDDTTFYMGDKGGVFTNSETTNNAYILYVATGGTGANVRGMKAFGGAIYVLQQSGSSDLNAHEMAVCPLPASGEHSLAPLEGFPIDANVLDFYMVQSDQHGSDYDTVYTIDETNLTRGEIFKYYNTYMQDINTGLNVWALAGSWATTNGGNGICAVTNASGGVDLYYTTDDGGTAGNAVIHMYDNTAYNAAMNVVATNTLYVASSSVILKGIAFAPIPPAGTLLNYPVGTITNITYSATGGIGIGAGMTFQFNSTAGEASSFSIWSTTNLLTPFSLWNLLGHPTEGPGGTYSFTDSSATNNPSTFYRVTSP